MIADHFCGQTQPHAAHVWQTPPLYGSANVISTYQCAGLRADPAKAWDEGYAAAVLAAQDRADGFVPNPRVNPYRKADA